MSAHQHTEEQTEEISLAKVSVKDGKACEKILKIEIGAEEIKKEFDEYYHHVAPAAKVPGFRPGKAPRNVLELHYAGDAREKVLKQLITLSYRQAVREKSLEPLSFPDIKDVKFDDSKLSYEASIEVRPKIKLSKVTGLSVKKQKTELKPEEIEEGLNRVRESLAKFKAVEDRPAQMEDIVIADYVCEAGGKEVEKREDDWFHLQKEEYLKGFSAQLVGVKPGDEKLVQVDFPSEFSKKELAGKPAVFKMKIKEIKIKILPDLNDEMAKEAGEYKTLAELKEKMEKDLRATKERDVEVKFEKDLMDEFLKQNKVELPEGLVQRRSERLMEDALQHFTSHGGAKEKSEELKNKIKAEVDTEARKQVHLAFLLDELAVREKIEVKPEDLKKKYESVGQQVRQPAEAVEKYYGANEDAREGLYDQIRNEKAIEYIKQNAKTE